MDPSGLWHRYRRARGTRSDFRGARWGASARETQHSEVEELRADGTGTSTLFGFEVRFRYMFGPAGLRGGGYEFRLQMSELDPADAFQQVLESLLRQYGLPCHLQRVPTAGGGASLLQAISQSAGTWSAAWVTETSEILLIKDDTATPLRLLYQARDESLFPDMASHTLAEAHPYAAQQ